MSLSSRAGFSIGFSLIRHLIAVPVTVNNSISTRFIFDTGIGLNIITHSLFERLRCKESGLTFSGKRMSGQEINLDLCTIPSISLGSSITQENVTVGVVKKSTTLPPELAEIGGLLGLPFFENTVFKIDYDSNNLIIRKSLDEYLQSPRPASVKDEEKDAPIRLQRDGPSLDAFLNLVLPNGEKVEVEIDTGSDALILHSKFMSKLQFSSDRQVEDRDETGHRFTRNFGRLSGKISIENLPEINQQSPEVMFQNIIYDGLVGMAFLKLFNPVFYLTKENPRITFFSKKIPPESSGFSRQES